jgi:hypothetical protein
VSWIVCGCTGCVKQFEFVLYMCLTVRFCAYCSKLSDVMTVSHEFIAEFFEMYHENSLLWKVTSRDYSDQVKKILL